MSRRRQGVVAVTVLAIGLASAAPTAGHATETERLGRHTTVSHDLADIDPIEVTTASVVMLVPPDAAAPVHSPDPAPSLAPAPRVEPPTPTFKRRVVTLLVGGDTGFGGSRQPVDPNAGVRNGKRYPHDHLTRHLTAYLRTSDLAFANLETVVTATNALTAYGKLFNFRMHPNGLAHLVVCTC